MDILNTLKNACTSHSIVTFIEDYSEVNGVRWLPVGDRENNLATINLGSDPAAGLIERITNAIDAVLELEWERRGQPTDVRSPRDAVEQWFDIKDGKLKNVNPQEKSIQKLGKKVQVSLRDSELEDRPTLDIRDFGVGIRPEDFRDSILSLNQSRKLKKFFLAGAFGQGGSTALAYSTFTLIISRHFSTDDDTVAATIVRFNPGDINRDKHGLYEYCVDERTGKPLVFKAPSKDFPHGTLVRHIVMDLGKYKAVMTAPTSSLWYLTHHYLFDPVLPVLLRECRDSKGNANRNSYGNYKRLEDANNTQYRRDARFTFKGGSVVLSWWVLNFPDDERQAKDAIRNYCLRSKPVIITYNGQKQGELPNTIIKDDLRLPYLDGFLVIHVDCDHLDNESRRRLFPTTRESLRDTSLLDELRTLVYDAVSADEQLKELNRKRKERMIKRNDTATIENLRKRLAKRVKVFTSAARGGGSTPTPPKPSESDGGGATRPPIPVQEPPTFLEITTPSPRTVYPDRSFSLKFRTDAHSSYFESADSFIAIIEDSSIGQFTGSLSVLDGYGTAYFRASENAEVGTESNIILELRPGRSRTLTDSIPTRVAELPDSSKPGRGDASSPNINPLWVDKNDQMYKTEGWDETSVAKVLHGDDSIDIFVSAENKHLGKLIARAQRRDQDFVASMKENYLEHVCYHALLQHLDQTRASQQTEENGDKEPLAVDEQPELSRVAATVCGIFEQMFDLVDVRQEEKVGAS